MSVHWPWVTCKSLSLTPPLRSSSTLTLLFLSPSFLILHTHNSDKDGPLMIFITHSVTKDGKKYAYGRVYSGTVRAGEEVRVLGPNAKADDEGVMRRIEKVGIPVGNTVVEVDIPIPCGNIVCLLIGDCEDKSTISNSKNAVPFRTRWSDEQRDDVHWAYQYHHIEDLFSGEKYS